MSLYELLEPGWRYREVVRFDVAGLPSSQGSKSAVSRGGKAWVVEGRTGRARVRLAAWREAVAAEARRYADDRSPILMPVACALTFRLPRLATMPVRSYKFHTTLPDIDKLCRATFDALTGIVWANDAQVVRTVLVKRYAEPGEQPGCRIVVGVVSAGEGHE